MNARSVVALALVAAVAGGCRSSAGGGSDRAIEIDVGSGSPDAVARRVATEFADAERLAERMRPVGDGDGRYALRFDGRPPPGSAASSAFRTMVANALVETGRFVLVDDEEAPTVSTRISGVPGDERALVRLASASGRTWISVSGDLVGRN